MNGTSPALLSLEERIAEREGFKYSLVMNTGFNANEIAIRTLLTSGIGIRNYINGDFTPPVAIQARSGVHASVAVPLNEIAQQGYLADKKQTGVKPYFDPQNPETLVPVLAKLAEAPVAERVVFVNGVGSTDGVTYDLRRIQEICREYGALLYVDDAHGGFTLGRNAEGICEYLGLPEPPDFYFTTFSKSAENEGGALYTNHEGFVEAFKYQATSIYTAASTPQKLEMIHAKLDYLDAYPEGAGDALAKKALRLHASLERAGVSISATNPETPILSLEVGGENIKGYLDWYKLLSEYGVYTNFFPVETSGKNKSILRLSISSNFFEPSNRYHCRTCDSVEPRCKRTAAAVACRTRNSA